MTSAMTPYVIGSPISNPEMFFGREDIFDFISQTLIGKHQDNGIFLYGQSRMGKTSVLRQMASRLEERFKARYVCIFIDLFMFELNDLNSFLWELARSAANTLLQDYGITLPDLDRSLFLNQGRDTFEKVFLPEVWSAIGNKHLLIMLDEAGSLQEKLKSEIRFMRPLFSHQKLSFIFSLITSPSEMEEEYAFLFNPLCAKKISFLDKSAVAALITQPVKDYYQIDPSAIEQIFCLTSGHPYYVQVLCHQLFNRWRIRGGSCITVQDVDAILSEAWEPASMVLQHAWISSTMTERAILAAMAAIMKDSDCLVEVNAIEQAWWQYNKVIIPKEDIIPAIKRLVERDIVVGVENYKFTVEIQHIWIRNNKRLSWVEDEIRIKMDDWFSRMSTMELPSRRKTPEMTTDSVDDNVAINDSHSIQLSTVSTMDSQAVPLDDEFTVPKEKKLFIPFTPIFPRRALIAGLIGAAGSGIGLAAWEATRKSLQNFPPPTVGTTLYIYTNHSEAVLALAWSPDSKRLVSGSQDKTAQVWDALTGENLLIFKNHASYVYGVAWNNSLGWIVSGSRDKTAQVWNAVTGKVNRIYKGHTGYVNVVVWSPDGKQVASGSQDKTVRIWDAETGKTVSILMGHTDSIYAVAWSPNGNYIASGGADGSVVMWDAFSTNALLAFQGHAKFVDTLAWSPDSKYIVTGGGDSLVKIWNITNGKRVRTYAGHSDSVFAVSWSPDGRHIVSGGEDTKVRVWEASSGRDILIYAGHTRWIGDVVWSPNGRYIASCGNDTTVRVWEAPH